MLVFLKTILYDQSAFERYTRAIIGGLGMAVATNQLPIPPKYAIPLVFLANLIGAGEKNAPPS